MSVFFPTSAKQELKQLRIQLLLAGKRRRLEQDKGLGKSTTKFGGMWKFTLAHQTQSTPCVVHNSKTIFLITIDIFPYETSASKRRVLEMVEITEKDLIRGLQEPD